MTDLICLFQYIFTDITNNYLFTTTNYGQTFTPIHVQFKPKTISIHPTKPTVVLAMDENDLRKRVCILTWHKSPEQTQKGYVS
jgi:hypothetical protein